MIHSNNVEFSELNNGFEIRSFSDGRIPSGFFFYDNKRIADACRDVIRQADFFGLDETDVYIGWMFFVEGIKHDDIAFLSDYTIGQVKGRIQKITKKAKRLLGYGTSFASKKGFYDKVKKANEKIRKMKSVSFKSITEKKKYDFFNHNIVLHTMKKRIEKMK